MSSTCIYQGMCNRIVNGKHTLNSSRYGYFIRFVKVVNLALGKKSDNVLRLLGTVSHEMLSAPALEVGVVKMMAGWITVIFPVVTTRLSILGRVTRRWVRGKNGYNTGSLLNTIEDGANNLSLLLLMLMLSIKIRDTLVSGCNKSSDCLGILRGPLHRCWASRS